MKLSLHGNLIIASIAVLATLACVATLRSNPPIEPYIDAADDAQNAPSMSGFQITSSVVAEGGLLPKEFTCDGEGISPPIAWVKAPGNTKSFAVVMQHIAGPGDLHWYWLVHHIPATVHAIAAANRAVGITGGNSTGPDAAYAPPCSKGPGPKRYSITVYALSAEPAVAPGAITRTQLLDGITDITLDHARLNFIYTR
jgi:phosphatidylethanolamine-binding protein (PEBP) family uncharacterized protein